MPAKDAVVRKLREWGLLMKSRAKVEKEAEEIIASNKVREDIQNYLTQHGVENFEETVDNIIEMHVYNSQAYKNQPRQLDKRGMELHARLAVLHVIATSLPDNPLDGRLSPNQFHNQNAISPVEINDEVLAETPPTE